MTTTVPLRFVIAPSGFKESLDAAEVADAIATGIRRVLPGALIDTVPLVDGGEGSARAMAAGSGGEIVPMTVRGPVGDPVSSSFGILGGPGPRTAIVEMAAAAGLRLVPTDRRDPGLTCTYGVGELIRAALDAGCRRIVVGCGDSGTCDGGAGALTALGARLLDVDGHPVGPGGYELSRVTTLDLSRLDPRLAATGIDLACNPHNVLTGPDGVARVFGPQKGATEEQVTRLAAAMDHWASLLQRSAAGIGTAAGSGASGGLGAGLAAIAGARLRPRFEVLLDRIDLDERLSRADVVITAEGAIDFQTPRGKIPAEVARRAKRHGKPVIALAGTIGRGAGQTYAAGIDAYAGILTEPVDLAGAMARTAELLAGATERTLRLLLLGVTMGHAMRRSSVGTAA